MSIENTNTFSKRLQNFAKKEDFIIEKKLCYIDVSENEGEIIFLHNIIPGASDKSYGVHVAQLAGIPKQVISRSYEILDELEKETNFKKDKNISKTEKQLPLIPNDTIIKSKLDSIDINKITPIDAINRLSELKNLSDKENN